MDQTIKALKAVCEWASASGHEAAQGYNEILNSVDWSNRRKTATPSTLPVVESYFKQAVDLAGDNPLGDLGRAAYSEVECFEWFTMYKNYEDDERVSSLHGNYAVLRLAAPAGDWYAEGLTTALSLQAPNVYYPPHVHRQREVYGIVGGEAEWQRGGEDHIKRTSGEIFYHPSGVRHETITKDEPLLCMASWIRYIDQPCIFVWD